MGELAGDRRALGLLGAAALAAAGAAAAAPGLQDGAIVIAALVLLAAATAVIAWYVDPAWTVSGALVLSIFNGNWGALGLPGFLAPDRLLLGMAILAVLVRAPAARSSPRIVVRPVHWLLLALTLYAVASAFLAGTLIDNPGSYRLLDRLGITPFLVFLIAPVVFHGPAQRRVLVGALVGLGAYLGVTAVFETAGPKALVFPRYILDPSVGVHFGRARGPFAQAAINGMALYTCAMACVLASAWWRRPAARIAAGVVGVLCVTSLLFTLQRSVWLGAGVAALTTMVVVAELRRYVLPGLATIAALMVAAVLLVPGLGYKITNRASQQETVWDRKNLNRAALNMAAERPLFGFGYTTFERRSGDYYALGSDYPMTVKQGQPVHSVFASNLAELGLVGTSLWVAALIAGVVVPLTQRAPPEARPWRIMLASAFVLWLTVLNLSPVLNVFPNMMIWLLAGIVAAFPAIAPQAEANAE